MKLRSSTQESLTGCALVAGLVLVVAGAFFSWVFGMGGVYRGTLTRDTLHGDRITDAGTLNLLPFTVALFFLGLFLILGALVYGFHVIGRQRAGKRRTIEYFRILARFATDRRGNMLTSDWQIEAEDNARYYVRASSPHGPAEEYEVSHQVFLACGEGMTGEAEVQGRWLGRFIPYIGTPPTSAP